MNLTSYLDLCLIKLEKIKFPITQGKIIRINGFFIEGVGLQVPVGSICKIQCQNPILMEVIGFSNDITFFVAFAEPNGVSPGAAIEFLEDEFKVPIGYALRGRVLNGFGCPIDDKGALGISNFCPVSSKSFNPFDRQRITSVLDVGVRAINSLLTVGIGQRLGIFAGSGVGKSILLGMVTRFTKVDIVVVGLIGERSREIKEFLEENIGADYSEKTVVIAAPINTSPLERANGILTAVTIAEYFRDLGHNVLLIIDSLTRYAHALRSMYVLFGEPVSSNGYPPSVFAKLSQLAERCGNGCGSNSGSITAFFTVLIDADDMNDPISDHMRSVLDGHIVLSRDLAEVAHYPAIDICKSISRVMANIVTNEHLDMAMNFKKIYSHYLQNEDLIKIGMYKSGTDTVLDAGIRLIYQFNQFLQQDVDDCITLNESLTQLQQVQLLE